MPEVMPSTDLMAGMTGVGYTVLDPSGDIQAFNVDVVGVLDGGKATGRRILANASGELIENAGAILSGMSGSPVYVDGKLIGALSASYQGMGESTFLITPIEEMLKIWQMPDNKNKKHLKSIDFKKIAEEKAKKENEKKENEKKEKTATDKKNAENAATTQKTDTTDKTDKEDKSKIDEGRPTKGNDESPIVEKSTFWATGFDEAGLSFLSDKLAPYGIAKPNPVSWGATGNLGTDYDAILEPGSPIGAALAYGDFSLVATGTVTAVDDRKILAFGHAFLHNGNVNYFLTDASVVGTISGRGDGMRLANVGNIIGRVSQDRNNGLAAEVGVFPDVVPVKVTVEDLGLGEKQSFVSRIAYDEELLPQIGAAMAYTSVGKVSDTKGESTATVDFTIRTGVAENGKFTRQNMYYSPADVGKIAIQELMQALSTICENTESESDIIDVQVNVKMDPERKTATLVSAVPEKTKVKPGETVNFTTTIKPYRKDKETLTIPFKVPENQPEGVMALDIKGGGLVSLTAAALLQQSGIPVVSEEEKAMSTADKLKKFAKTDKNNEIIIQPGVAPVGADKNKKPKISKPKANTERKISLLGKGKEETAANNKFATNYIIDNVIHATLQVEGE